MKARILVRSGMQEPGISPIGKDIGIALPDLIRDSQEPNIV